VLFAQHRFLFNGIFMAISLNKVHTTFFIALLCVLPGISFAQEAPQATIFPPGPDMDLTINYFNREITTDGVVHESSYVEKMIRRKGHVWTQRVLPNHSKIETTQPNHEHRDFNYVVLPRHVSYDGSKTNVEFVDPRERQIICIAPTEYENVNFDGSWANAYYLISPQIISLMPISARPSTAAHTQWHVLDKNGLFQRVLWDEKMNIPLIIETGDKAGTFLQRIKVQRDAKLVKNPPWNMLQGYVQKEYSDFLD
jgi:hypothetical protein